MQPFVFHNPTKIIFGDNTSSKLGEHAKNVGKKALFIYGQNSIKKSGLYDSVLKQLKENGISFVEHGGVKSNPTLEHAREGVKKVLDNGVDFIVAVGGGSVLDEAKAISGAAASKIDVWEIFTKEKHITKALPLVTILTLPATGSEMNPGMVITNSETKEKLGMGHPLLYPRISILDPILTYSVPLKNTAYSSVDIVSHLTESYFTNDGGWTPIQERYVEGLVKTIIEATAKIMQNPKDNEARATMMWGATLGWNGLNTAGVGAFSMACHTLEHPISALYDIAHGAGLSIVTPAWMKNNLMIKTRKFAQFAREVFNVQDFSDVQAAELGIEELTKWYKTIGSPTTFKEAGIEKPDVELLTKLTVSGAVARGITDLDEKMIKKIFNDCI